MLDGVDPGANGRLDTRHAVRMDRADPPQAVASFLHGRIDAVILVSAPESPLVLNPDQAQALAAITGAPTYHDGKLFVPVNGINEELQGGRAQYECCTFRGSIVALRIRDGEQVWKTYLVPEAKPTGKTKRGTPQFGPSGAGVWDAPTLDPKRGVMYVATGDNYSSPATNTSDAVVALEIATGKIAWVSQVQENDAYNSSCGTDKQNCPDEDGPDYDFGSSAILTKLPDGRDVLLAGQKSGLVYAFDPDKKGAVLWKVRITEAGPGSPTSVGVQWGMATDGQRIFAATSSSGRTAPKDPMDTRRNILDPNKGGGLTALRVADGSKIWYAPPIVCPANAPAGCSPAQSAAVTALPGRWACLCCATNFMRWCCRRSPGATWPVPWSVSSWSTAATSPSKSIHEAEYVRRRRRGARPASSPGPTLQHVRWRRGCDRRNKSAGATARAWDTSRCPCTRNSDPRDRREAP